MTDAPRPHPNLMVGRDDSMWRITFRSPDDLESVRSQTRRLFKAIWDCQEGFARPADTALYFTTHSEVDDYNATKQSTTEADRDGDRTVPEEQAAEISETPQWEEIDRWFSKEGVVPMGLEMEPEVRFTFESGDIWANERRPEFFDDEMNRMIYTNPLQIWAGWKYLPPKSEHYLLVRTETNIWWEDSEVGAQNRERLARFFNCVCRESGAEVVDTMITGYFPDYPENSPYGPGVPEPVQELHPDNLCSGRSD